MDDVKCQVKLLTLNSIDIVCDRLRVQIQPANIVFTLLSNQSPSFRSIFYLQVTLT